MSCRHKTTQNICFTHCEMVASDVSHLDRIEGHMNRFMYRYILNNNLFHYIEEMMPLNNNVSIQTQIQNCEELVKT